MKPKILVVDDTRNIRMLLSDCLEIRGYEVLSAENGKIALDIMENERENIKLIFLDIRMPQITGTEVLRKIRLMNINCLIIIMTAFATIKNAVDCTKLGAIAYLQKPFSPDRINALLDDIEKKHFIDIPKTCEESVLLTDAKDFMYKGNLEAASDSLKIALSINPYNGEIYTLIAQLNEQKNNLKEATRFYSIAKLFE